MLFAGEANSLRLSHQRMSGNLNKLVSATTALITTAKRDHSRLTHDISTAIAIVSEATTASQSSAAVEPPAGSVSLLQGEIVRLNTLLTERYSRDAASAKQQLISSAKPALIDSLADALQAAETESQRARDELTRIRTQLATLTDENAALRKTNSAPLAPVVAVQKPQSASPTLRSVTLKRFPGVPLVCYYLIDNKMKCNVIQGFSLRDEAPTSLTDKWKVVIAQVTEKSPAALTGDISAGSIR